MRASTFVGSLTCAVWLTVAAACIDTPSTVGRGRGTPGTRGSPKSIIQEDGGNDLVDGALAARSASVNFVNAGSTSEATCPSPEIQDDESEQRRMCNFSAGATADETLAFMPTRRAAVPLSHVIVMMKENHSYDRLFGKLYQRGQPDSEPLAEGFVNLDTRGAQVRPFHATTTCPHQDQDHQWHAMHVQVDGGKMDGFVKNAAKKGADGHDVMAWYDDSDVPFYYFLANTFAIADHYYPSVRSGTFPNRDYLLLGTSDGVQSTGKAYPHASLPTVFTLLDARGVSWAVYTSHGDSPFEGTLNWPKDHPGVSDIAEFYARLADGSLPQVVFVDGGEQIEDEHPRADVQVGEAWTYGIYQAARRSPLWRSLVILYTYDEAGGFFDHVPPPNDGCVARPTDSAYFELGIRVPLIVISRFARSHYVSHLRHEHTSILRFIEVIFDLPALTARDANSDALLDMFDFECPNDALAEPPSPGTGGCK